MQTVSYILGLVTWRIKQKIPASSGDLATGKYTYSASFSTANTFDEGIIGLEYDIANETGTFLELEGGTVDVSKEGSTYTITLNGVLANGKSVTGRYKGTLTKFDYSDEWDNRKKVFQVY